MEELLLPVNYNNTDYEFPLRIVPQGYVYHFLVQINGAEVIFERDDSGNFRAILPHQHSISGQLPDAGLLAAIIEVLQQL